ncbi:hypothetical protein [Neolewinella antarctica]|uniref:Uncharacterized protein n=1 Tax=Neolewinella antarctica TaxID=442734 RepID=A0ABX0XBN7_9BACT|nr:hypothetical protein [Neolewinella antarctica]NJC26693.1 hypothetical protein [Neolewinella antarctica]
MPQTNADRLLRRITALHKSLHLEEGGHVTSMERDLMLNYLRDLHEIYASGSVASPVPGSDKLTFATPLTPAKNHRADQPLPPPAPKLVPQTPAVPASVTAPPKVSVPPQPPQIQHRPAYNVHTQPTETPAPAPAPREMERAPSAPSTTPVVAQTSDASAPNIASSSSAPAVVSFAKVAESTPTPTRPAQAAATTKDGDKKLKVLFESRGPTSRFGRQPISDLTRALSINNRILFSRDLFGNDNEMLNTTLAQLNTCQDLADAKPLVTSLARRFNWTEEKRMETAQEFIEIVRRRYV